MQKLWELLDGKKTITSAQVLFVSAIIKQVVIGIWGIDEPWLHNLSATLDWIGGSGVLIGTADKVRKASNAKSKKLQVPKE